MKKLINLIALVMLVSTNVLTPFSYAEVENPEVIPENGVETVEECHGEVEEIPEINEETPELVPEEKGELEQENAENVAPENVLPNIQNDEETPSTDETEEEDTESDGVAHPVEETPEKEIQDEEENFEELERVEESVVMDVIPNTSVMLLPGQEFNSVIKTLANGGTYVAYTGVDNNIQSFERVDEIPQGVTTGEISVAGSEYPVHAWFSGGILYYITKAETIQLNENSQNMFQNFGALTELDLSSFDTSNVTNVGQMFQGCSSLDNLNMNNWDLNNINSRIDMFNGCSELENISIDNRNVSKGVGIAGSMFSGLPKLKKMSARNWKIPISFADWLGRTRGLRKLEEIDVSNWDLTETKDLGGLFADVENLKTIKGLDTWDTSGVQNMGQMFQGCTGLTGLDLSNFDTSKVTNMYMMFDRCDNLEVLNLSGWDFREYGSDSLSRNLLNAGYNNHPLKRLNLTNAKFSGSMNGAFEWLSLEEIKLDGVDTTNVTSMNSMFHSNRTNKIKNLDLSSFDTSNVTNMSEMFNGCSVENLNMSGWDFRKYDVSSLLRRLFPSGTYGSDMKLKNLNLTNSKFSGSMSQAFRSNFGSPTLEKIVLNGVSTSGVTNMNHMFGEQKLLKGLDLSSFDTSNVTDMSYMFFYCTSLTGLDLSNFDTSKVTDMSNMFYDCNSLTGLNLNNFDTSKVMSMQAMFGGCNKLEEINMNGWDFKNINNNGLMMNITAGGIPSLKRLNMINTKYTGSAGFAFGGLNKLEELNLNGADTRGVTSMSAMFYLDSNLKELELGNWNTSNVTNMGGMFLDCSSLTGLNLSSFNTSNVTSMSDMFNGCSNLTGLDLSNFDTSKVVTMGQMFYNTPNLKTIYASDKFVTDNVTSHGDMFTNDIALVGGNGTKFDSGYIDKIYAKIDKVGQTGYFTDKNAINVKFINTLDGTETTSTFAKGQKLTPPSVNGYHVVGGYLDEAMTQAIDLNKGVNVYSEIYVKYERNGSSGGGGGGGSSKDTDKDTHGSAEDSQKNTQDDKNTENVIQSDPEHSEWGSEESSNTPIDSSDKSSEGQEILSPSDSSFTKEQKDAYTFAKENGITTKDTIQSAQMNGKLTRIAMAKMLSQYAINVLGETPDTSKTVKFKDVSNKKDADYDNGVTLAYQLGIMGQNMPNNRFRPNDEVSRAEFVTALSRLLYSTPDGEYKSTSKYYIHHMEKLVKEGIITNDDPKMKERRGYVMIMLMRSAK